MPFRNLPGTALCHFQPGERLITVGENVEHVYYLVSGIVYRIMLTESGSETIVSRKVGGHDVASLIGIFVLYSGDAPHVAVNDFIAHNECVCYRIPKESCMEYFRQHPLMMEKLLRESMNEYAFLAKKFWAKKEKSASAQLCDFLLEYSRETPQGRILPKQYTNIEIAKFLSVHRVTVANMLRTLKTENCVERTEQGLLLKDVALLSDYAAHRKILEYSN